MINVEISGIDVDIFVWLGNSIFCGWESNENGGIWSGVRDKWAVSDDGAEELAANDGGVKQGTFGRSKCTESLSKLHFLIAGRSFSLSIFSKDGSKGARNTSSLHIRERFLGGLKASASNMMLSIDETSSSMSRNFMQYRRVLLIDPLAKRLSITALEISSFSEMSKYKYSLA